MDGEPIRCRVFDPADQGRQWAQSVESAHAHPPTAPAMKALITGGGGFVGPHLSAHLGAAGDEVTVTDRQRGGPDICDAEAIGELLADVRPDVVYHLAGDSDVGGSWHHPLDTFRANAEGTLNVLTAAREAGVARVVSIGSADVYGVVAAEHLPLREDAPLRPVSPYAASKAAADFLGLQAWLGHGLEVVRVRAFNHLGPGQSERFLAPGIAMRIARNERSGGEVVPVGNLTPQRDLTDVRDVVRAYRLLAVDGAPGEVYNVCSGRALAVSEVAVELLKLADRPMRLEPDPELQRPVDVPVLCGDNSRIRAATGWRPEIPLLTTLKDLMEDCRRRAATAVEPPAVP